MPFQNRVSLYNSPGIPGSYLGVNRITSTEIGYVAGENGCYVANFVWADPDNEGIALMSGTGAPLGIAVRNLVYPLSTYAEEASLFIPQGRTVNVALKWGGYVISTTAATRGQAVFASTTDGSIATGAAGSTVAGHVETPWVVLRDAAIGDIFPISNWRDKVIPAATGGGE